VKKPDKSILALLQDRAALAEDCLKRVLDYLDPTLLDRHNFDYVAAVAEVLA
jgi:hypothetical protein